jgi:hypothetical protein
LSAASDKGQALTFLSTLYQLQWQSSVRVIAMGDAPNDLTMLACANVPILLASSAGVFDPGVTAALPHVRKVSRDTPDAWSRAVLQAVLEGPETAVGTQSGTEANRLRVRSARFTPSQLRRLVKASTQLPCQVMKRA